MDPAARSTTGDGGVLSLLLHLALMCGVSSSSKTRIITSANAISLKHHLSLSNEAIETVGAHEATETVRANEATETVRANEATETVRANEATETVRANEATETVRANEAIETVGANEATETVRANEATETVRANESNATARAIADDSHSSFRFDCAASNQVIQSAILIDLNDFG
jgi:hypothetical protein